MAGPGVEFATITSIRRCGTGISTCVDTGINTRVDTRVDSRIDTRIIDHACIWQPRLQPLEFIVERAAPASRYDPQHHEPQPSSHGHTPPAPTMAPPCVGSSETATSP